MRDVIKKRLDLANRQSKGENGSQRILIVYEDDADPEGAIRDAFARYGRANVVVVRALASDRGVL